MVGLPLTVYEDFCRVVMGQNGFNLSHNVTGVPETMSEMMMGM